MCPACANKRLHAPEDWAQHPYAGHGFAAGQGWTHPDLEPINEKEKESDAR